MNILTRRLLSIIVMVLVWVAGALPRADDVVGPSVTELTIEQAAKLVVAQGDLELSDLHVLSPQVAAFHWLDSAQRSRVTLAGVGRRPVAARRLPRVGRSH